MTSKIDIRMIVSDHLATFKDEGTGKVSRQDWIVMIGLPVASALLAGVLCFEIPDKYIGTLISVFAIFAGLLFNVLVLIYSVSDTNIDGKKSIRDRLLNQTFSNISYSILLALITVFLLTSVLFTSGWVEVVTGLLIVAVAANFFLSLLMVLKRIHVLLREKFGG